MRKVRRTPPIVLSASVILAVLAVAGHAGKPTPPPQTVVVTGGITGTGSPNRISVRFVDPSLLVYQYPIEGANQGPVFISNPDSPALDIVFVVPGPDKVLRYRYCVHPSHIGSGELVCNSPSHDPDYYFGIRISGGVTAKKGNSNPSQVTFPSGSPYLIAWKKTMGTVWEGKLSQAVRYDLTQ